MSPTQDNGTSERSFPRAFAMKTWIIISTVFFLAAHPLAALGEGKPACLPIEKQPVKLEAWLSKKYVKEFKWIRKIFGAMGNTRVTLWPYPADNPSGIVAIGRCVPGYIAQYVIRRALDYTAGVNSLVHQGFLSPYWIGVGTNLFARNSRQSVSAEQVQRLVDEDLTTGEFQALYREFSSQDETVNVFGVTVPNPKLMKE